MKIFHFPFDERKTFERKTNIKPLFFRREKASMKSVFEKENVFFTKSCF